MAANEDRSDRTRDKRGRSLSLVDRPTVQPCAIFSASRPDRASCARLHACKLEIRKDMPESFRKMLDAVASLGFATPMDVSGVNSTHQAAVRSRAG